MNWLEHSCLERCWMPVIIRQNEKKERLQVWERSSNCIFFPWNLDFFFFFFIQHCFQLKVKLGAHPKVFGASALISRVTLAITGIVVQNLTSLWRRIHWFEITCSFVSLLFFQQWNQGWAQGRGVGHGRMWLGGAQRSMAEGERTKRLKVDQERRD